MRYLIRGWLAALLISPAALASPTFAPDVIMLCHGVGQTVASVQMERANGASEQDNEGLKILRDLEDTLQQDLHTPVENFLAHTSALPPHWTAALFTHACLFDYTDDLAQVALMSERLTQQCDLALASPDCLQQVYAELPILHSI